MEFAKTPPSGQTPRDLNHVLVQTAWFKNRLKLSAQASIHSVNEVEGREHVCTWLLFANPIDKSS